ncbi:MAG: cytochrome c biogenesis protein CcdA [Clostridiaceae bacterium]|nr:cytochrome c biogenesis protein CcdA [Clostridiaceae bacterium]
MNEMLETMSEIIKNNFWIAPIISLLAGILTSFTPCSLSSVPLVIGCVGGTGIDNTKRAFKLSVVFAIGMAITFTILGALASILGKFMQSGGSWWYIILGIIMVMMAMQTFEVVTFIKSTNFQTKNTKKGYFGALIAGILGGVFSSPCSTPVLIALLALVANSGNMIWGIFLLLLYSIGHSILVVIAGTSFGTIKKLTQSQKYGKISTILKYVMGTIILLIGFYMFYLGF